MTAVSPAGLVEEPAEGAVHALGNGRLVTYGRGPDLTHVFGPVYSTAPLLRATWSGPAGRLPSISRRERGAGIWTHELVDPAGNVLGRIQTAIDPVHDILVWRVEAPTVLVLELAPARPGRWSAAVDGGSATLTTRPGAPVFIYPDPAAPVARLAVDDGVRLLEQGGRLRAELSIGRHDLRLAVAVEEAGVDAVVAAAGPAETVVERRRRADRLVTGPLAGRAERWAAVPKWGGLAAARLEGAVLSVLAQQSFDGGILAGYPYPLAYGRDQYGTCRGLAAVGLVEQSRRNFEFRHAKLRRFGKLANAESMGHDGVRHRHENDDVELTSYHVLHAVELAEDARGGLDLDPLIDDLLECLRIQLEHIRTDLLPFNGDETYVAGGILPRSTLEDGSLESTLLFVEAARRLCPHAGASGRRAPEVWAAAEGIDATWRRHFGWAAGIGGLATNAPTRRHVAPVRTERRGVCESCGRIGHDIKQRTGSGRYVCESCRADGRGAALPVAPEEQFSLLSASLLPFLVRASILTEAERHRFRTDAFDAFDASGQLRTLASNPKAVGYDAALLVLAAAGGTDPARDRAVGYLLDRFDEADMLAEYYLEGRPTGTRCRPWETGVALAALQAAVDAAEAVGSGR